MWSQGNAIIKQHVLSDSDCTGSWGWGWGWGVDVGVGWGVDEQSFSHGKHNEGGVDGDSDVPAKYTLYWYIYDTISKNFQKINWLIAGCLNLNDQHFIHIQDGLWCLKRPFQQYFVEALILLTFYHFPLFWMDLMILG